MSDCAFCAMVEDIGHGRGPTPLYKNRAVFVVQDENPKAEHHLLVIPWQHVESLDVATAGTVLAVMTMVQRVGHELGGEYRVIVNVGEGGKQTVPHLHAHVLAGPQVAEPGFARDVA